MFYACRDKNVNKLPRKASDVQTQSNDCTELFLWFNWNAEPSTFTRRTFAIATPKVRQDDAEPSATSWIQRNASVNPQMRFWKTHKVPLQIPSPPPAPPRGREAIRMEKPVLKLMPMLTFFVPISPFPYLTVARQHHHLQLNGRKLAKNSSFRPF